MVEDVPVNGWVNFTKVETKNEPEHRTMNQKRHERTTYWLVIVRPQFLIGGDTKEIAAKEVFHDLNCNGSNLTEFGQVIEECQFLLRQIQNLSLRNSLACCPYIHVTDCLVDQYLARGEEFKILNTESFGNTQEKVVGQIDSLAREMVSIVKRFSRAKVWINVVLVTVKWQGCNNYPFPMGVSETSSSAAGAGPFDVLRNSPEFQAFKDMVQANPHLLQPMLQEWEKENPPLWRLIQENRAEFLRLVNEPSEGRHLIPYYQVIRPDSGNARRDNFFPDF
ncbi:hypothetical protein GH714_035141 [Hevea brasiliensis]|uniref:XPC-binding domain-containing protein n=1 Tax=Hevea brasiliensis TaxID=3981 RepID=A0A6A6NED8_HEVBR|nr:hypothetical protein GH714_035141 [Hevea brasiliensis]